LWKWKPKQKKLHIDALDGAEWMGRNLKVNKATRIGAVALEETVVVAMELSRDRY